MSPKKVWVPKAWKDTKKGRVFCLSATHSGDMYHIRAAQILSQNSSLILYEYANQRVINDLVEYLSALAFQTLVVPWSYEQLTNEATSPELTDLCRYGAPLDPFDGKDYSIARTGASSQFDLKPIEYRTEGVATSIIATDPKDPADLIAKMILLQGENASSRMTKVMEDVVKRKLVLKDWDMKQKGVLVMYRDSGSMVNGAYPEYDTGLAGLKTIMKTVSDYGCVPVASGTPKTGEFKDIKSINDYWIDFDKTMMPQREQAWTLSTNAKTITKPWITTRDAEAYYLLYLFEHKYIHMGTGLRSGAIDLLTFLGIPTVSIGLTDMIGEDRHDLLLTKEGFKRVNVRYSQPRHTTTARILSNVKGVQKWPLTSPFWTETPPPPPISPLTAPTPGEQAAARARWANPDGEFATYDKEILRIGLGLMCTDRLGATAQLKKITGGRDSVITAEQARYFLPVVDPKADDDTTLKSRIDYINAKSTAEADDWSVRMTRSRDLREYNEAQFIEALKSTNESVRTVAVQNPSAGMRGALAKIAWSQVTGLVNSSI